MCCVRCYRKKTLTYKTYNNITRDVAIPPLFHCAVRITSMTMENDECVKCRSTNFVILHILKIYAKIKASCSDMKRTRHKSCLIK